MIRTLIATAGALGVGLAVAACSPQHNSAAVTVTVTVTAPPVTVTAQSPAPTPGETVPTAHLTTPVASTFDPRGAYAVGAARGGLTDVIAPGRYRASGVNGAGFVNHCRSALCGMSSSDPDVTHADIVDATVILEIPPTDVAIFVFDVTLTRLV
jgi:hypothetical protein